MAQVGRISGPLLFANLERNGIDLSFKNTLSDEPLIFLDVTNNTIGINRDTASQQVDISGVARTDNLITDNFSVPDFIINNNTISVTVGDLILDSEEAVRFSALAVDGLKLDDNTIFSRSSNESIEITPSGTGELNVNSNLNVFGNIFTPGNITLEGNITFGNELTEDTVDFASEINSDIIPKDPNQHSLGRPDKRWKDTYTRLVNGESVVTNDIIAGAIDFNLRQGRIIYVDPNGNDENTGTHKQDPVRTIKQALSLVTETESEPIAIFVNSGEYLEELPLEIPNRVSIIGANIRNTVIKPAAGFESNNVFLLDGDTTIQDLTVKDFFDGYAFSYSPSATVIGRSPYIQNVSVITKGSVTTAEDPRGYQTGDAGKGALVDGAIVDSSVTNPSMLFSQCTFITPGVTALEAKNGVRIEWLFCFTYFASVGISALDDVEIRAMSCANVYGEKGVVADGANTILYLISHNFAYIGSEFSTDNDRTQSITENEITELNGARVFHNSIDETGTYKIGSDFFVDFETGQTTLSSEDVTADSFTQLNFTSGDSETLVNANVIETGLLRFSQNNFLSLSGDINLNTQGILDIDSSVNITKTVSLNNLTVNTNTILGTDFFDEVTVNSSINSNIVPSIANTYDLGSAAQEWKSLFTNRLYTQDILIQNNFIETRTENSDLVLEASGVGNILFENNTLFDQDFEVLGNTETQNINTQNLQLQSDLSVNKDQNISELLGVSQSVSVGAKAQFENILINNNFITTTQSNSDLELRANQTGKIKTTNNNVQINNNLSVNTLQSQSNVNIVFSAVTPDFTVSDINFLDNVISVNDVNLNLTANGTGLVNLEGIGLNNNVVSTGQNFVIKPNTTFSINSTGSLQVPVGPGSYIGSLADFRFDTDDNLFEAYNVGRISFGGVFSDDRKTTVTATDTSNIINLKVNDLILGTVDSDVFDIHKIQVDNIFIDQNIITTDTSQDLLLIRDGTGKLLINNQELLIDNNFNNTGNSLYNFNHTGFGYAKFNATTGLVLPQGTTAEQDPSPPIGDVRFNTDTDGMEVFDGANYIRAAGIEETVTEEEYNELVELFTLVLG